MLTIRIPGALRPWARPRFNRATGTTFTDAKSRTAQNWIKDCAVQQIGQPCVESPIALDIVVSLTVPKSWSRLKQARALSGELKPVSRPDCDNYIKQICDSLNGLLYRDDAQIWRVSLTKRYAEAPETVVTVTLTEQASFAFRERAA